MGSSIYFLKNNLKKEFAIQCVFCLTLGNGFFFSFIDLIILLVFGDSEILYKVVACIGYPLDIFFSDIASLFAIISAYVPLIIMIGKKILVRKRRNRKTEIQ